MKIAAVDIGGTRLRAGIFDEEYRLLKSLKTANDLSRGAGENMAPITIHNWDYIEMAAAKAARYINYPPEELIVKPAVFGDDAGFIGAALLA